MGGKGRWPPDARRAASTSIEAAPGLHRPFRVFGCSSSSKGSRNSRVHRCHRSVHSCDGVPPTPPKRSFVPGCATTRWNRIYPCDRESDGYTRTCRRPAARPGVPLRQREPLYASLVAVNVSPAVPRCGLPFPPDGHPIGSVPPALIIADTRLLKWLLNRLHEEENRKWGSGILNLDWRNFLFCSMLRVRPLSGHGGDV
jgi:hypothetical protein